MKCFVMYLFCGKLLRCKSILLQGVTVDERIIAFKTRVVVTVFPLVDFSCGDAVFGNFFCLFRYPDPPPPHVPLRATLNISKISTRENLVTVTGCEEG